MRVLDLFSGIGGFSLGLERAGMTTVAFCEIDPFCRAVLKKHWPEVPCYDDIRTLTAERLAADGIAVDLICGGFPCQDISLAGNGAGLSGHRSGLWFEYERLIGEIRPAYIIIENVSALRSRGLDAIFWQIYSLGYDAEWHCIPASAIGAPHRRDRVWIIAYPQGSRREQGHSDAGGYGERKTAQKERRGLAHSDQWKAEPDVGRVAHGVPSRVYRLRSLGNAVVPQIPEIIGRAIMEAA